MCKTINVWTHFEKMGSCAKTGKSLHPSYYINLFKAVAEFVMQSQFYAGLHLSIREVTYRRHQLKSHTVPSAIGGGDSRQMLVDSPTFDSSVSKCVRQEFTKITFILTEGLFLWEVEQYVGFLILTLQCPQLMKQLKPFHKTCLLTLSYRYSCTPAYTCT